MGPAAVDWGNRSGRGAAISSKSFREASLCPPPTPPPLLAAVEVCIQQPGRPDDDGSMWHVIR